MFLLKRENFEAFTTVPNAFAAHELDLIRDMIKQDLSVAAVGGEQPGPNKDVRDSRVKWLMPDGSASSQWVFERVTSIVNTVNDQYMAMDLRSIEGIQLTEYDAEYDGFYGGHIDCSYGQASTRHRKLSVTMQLSDPEDYEGGDLLLYHENIKNPFYAARAKGSMTLFRSHIIHEVTPVTKGVRYSLVTWVHGPLFK